MQGLHLTADLQGCRCASAWLLAESHLCVHTWPEQAAVTLEVYVCNFGADHSAKAHALMNALLTLLEATTVQRHALQLGELRPVPESLVP